MSPSDPPMGLLLVDDHTIVREGLRRVLETASDAWQITEAGSGFQALQCLRERPSTCRCRA
jgi:DNA-binding NarL/FixJ family response regulator